MHEIEYESLIVYIFAILLAAILLTCVSKWNTIKKFTFNVVHARQKKTMGVISSHRAAIVCTLAKYSMMHHQWMCHSEVLCILKMHNIHKILIAQCFDWQIVLLTCLYPLVLFSPKLKCFHSKFVHFYLDEIQWHAQVQRTLRFDAKFTRTKWNKKSSIHSLITFSCVLNWYSSHKQSICTATEAI